VTATSDFHLQKLDSSEKKFAVLIPCLNEELTIGRVVADFKKNLPFAKIYVFDNRSKDQTARVAQEAGAIVIPSPIAGKGHVVRHMFNKVDADVYVMVDGDDTYPALAAKELIKKVLFENCDMAVGMRLENFDNTSFRPMHQFGNKLVSRLIRSFFSSTVTDVMSGYRAFSRDFVKTIPLSSPGFEIETEITLQAISKGMRISEVPIHYGTRPEGSFSKLNTYRDGILVLKSIFMIMKDYRPLVFFSICSGVLAVLSLAAGWLPIWDYVQTRFVHHVPLAILSAGIGILSVLLFGVGLILDTICKYHNENFDLWRRVISKEKDEQAF
jgi:glycosyltransferase involved in cell wall biosynthesis